MSEWRSARLAEHHELGGFDSGAPVLDRWLREHARRADAAGASRTFVWTAPGLPEVVGFHTIAPTQVLRDDLPSRRLPGGFSVIPRFLLGRLALDRALQGQGLGTQMLLDALERIVAAADRSGGRLIAVDALDDRARAFYLRHDFVAVDGSRRLYLKIAAARAALG